MISKPVYVVALLATGLGGCASALPPAAFKGGMPKMRPEIFFGGTTASTGVLENRDGAPTKRFHVEGHGQMLPDGSFRLDQSVTFGHGAPKLRSWIMRRVGAHHYTATLTDASGPVKGEAYGNLFYLRYPMKTPLGGEMKQWLYLQPDGHTVVNEATVSVLGVVAAHLSERITHQGP